MAVSLAASGGSSTGTGGNTGTSFVLTLPTWTVGTDDWIFIFVSVEFANNTLTTPSGYTAGPVGSSSLDATTVGCFYKKAVSGDSGAAVTLAYLTASKGAATVMIYAGCGGVDVSAGHDNGAQSTAVTFAAITPTNANEPVLLGAGARASANGATTPSFTAPTGYADTVNTQTSASGAINVDAGAFDLLSNSNAAGVAYTPPNATDVVSVGAYTISLALLVAAVAQAYGAPRQRPRNRLPRRLNHTRGPLASADQAQSLTQILSAASATTALMQRDTTKAIGPLASPSVVTIVKAATKEMDASTAASGSLAKQLPRALTTSAASVAAITRQIGKRVTASSLTSASIIRNVGKLLTLSSASSASVAKRVSKTLTATSASAVSLLASRLFLRALSVTSAAVATLVKQVNKPLSASSTSATAIGKAVAKTLSLTSAAAASMLASKFFTRSLTALSATTATLFKQAGKPLSASASSAASISRAVGKTVSAVSPAVASIVKRAVKTLSATSASVASLVAQRVTLVVLTAASASVVTIARAASKTIVTSSPAVASLVKNARKTLTAASGSTATIIKQRTLTMAAVSATIASFGARAIGKALSTTSTTSTTIKRSTSKTLSTVSAAVPSIVVSGAQTLFKTLSAVGHALASIIVRFFPRTTYPPPVLLDSAIATLALTDAALPNYRNIVMALNPTAYWRLGDLTGVTVDEVGARPGTVVAGVVRGVAGGQIADNDKAMTFDGATGYIDLGANGIDLSAGDWTISALVNPIDLTAAWHQILSGGQYSYGIGVTTTDFRVTIMTQADAPASGYMPPLGVWTRLGATFIKATGQLTYYVNGVPIRVVTFNTVPAVLGVKSRYIGGSGVMYPNWWHGSIDELVVYPYALQPAQMLAQHELGASGFGAVAVTDFASASAALVDQSVYAPLVAAILNDGPLAYWRLNDAGSSVVDMINGYQGVIAGGVTSVPGLTSDGDGAMQFDGGSTTRISFADIAALDGGQLISIECLVQLPLAQTHAFARVIDKQLDPGLGWCFNQDNGTARLALRIDTSAGANQLQSTSSTVFDGKRHHLWVVINNGVRKVYVDGVLDFSGTYLIGAGGFASAQPITFGARGNNTAHLTGLLDEVAIYGFEPSAAQVLAHATAAGLVAAGSATLVDVPVATVALLDFD